jgi:hypothetical protein
VRECLLLYYNPGNWVLGAATWPKTFVESF